MKIERLIAIVMILLERDIVNAKELAETFEVTTRTIFRDVETINAAGIPIFSTMGPKGGISIIDTFKVDKKIFTMTDISSLIIALNGVDTAIKSSDFTNILAKIKSLVPQSKAQEYEKKFQQIHIDLTPWLEEKKYQESLSLVKQSINNNHLLKLQYRDFNDNVSERLIEPYSILHKSNSWYLQGYCLSKNSLRTFRFSRIQYLEETNISFEPRDIDFSQSNDFSLKDSELINCIVRFHKDFKTEITEAWGEEAIIFCQEDYYIANIFISNNNFGYQSLFSMSSYCECLEPERIRKIIVEKVRNAKAIYNIV